MNFLVKIQDKIVNLANVTNIRRCNPGDDNPSSSIVRATVFKKHVIYFEFNVASGQAEDFDPACQWFTYNSADERNKDWKRLCDIARQR